MLRGDIRYEQGCADEKPSDIAAGEEIVFGRAFLPGKIHADPEDDGEIDPNDDEINGCERSVGYGDRRCEKHPGLLGVRRRRTKLNLRKFPLTFAASSTSVRPLAVIFFLEPPTIQPNRMRRSAPAKSITGVFQAQCKFRGRRLSKPASVVPLRGIGS